MRLGELSGWTSVVLGQLVSWPQVLKLRRERGDGVSLASYAIVLVSMSLFLVHAVAIGDPISTVSVPLSLIPNVLIAVTLVKRRRTQSADDLDGNVDPSELRRTSETSTHDIFASSRAASTTSVPGSSWEEHKHGLTYSSHPPQP